MESLWKPGQPLPDNRWLLLGFLAFVNLVLSGAILLASPGAEDVASGQAFSADSNAEPGDETEVSLRAVADDSAPQEVEPAVAEESTTSTSAPTTTTRPRGEVPLPDVVGVEFNEALLALFDFNVRIEREDEPSDDVAEGLIISTDPEPGDPVGEEAVVVVTVSSGPE